MHWAATSCNDEFLERYPEGTTTEASAFTSYNSSMSYLLTLYNCFNGFTIYSGPIPVSGALGTSTRDIWSGILTNYGYGAGTVDTPMPHRTSRFRPRTAPTARPMSSSVPPT
mgnify:CR=1 FL=1